MNEVFMGGRRSGKTLASTERFIRRGGGTVLCPDIDHALRSLRNTKRILARLGLSSKATANVGHFLLASDDTKITFHFPMPDTEFHFPRPEHVHE